MDTAGARVAARIRELRTKRGLTYEQLAVYSGLSGPTIRRIEAGTISPRVVTLEAIADALGVNVTSLLRPPEKVSA